MTVIHFCVWFYQMEHHLLRPLFHLSASCYLRLFASLTLLGKSYWIVIAATCDKSMTSHDAKSTLTNAVKKQSFLCVCVVYLIYHKYMRIYYNAYTVHIDLNRQCLIKAKLWVFGSVSLSDSNLNEKAAFQFNTICPHQFCCWSKIFY